LINPYSHHFSPSLNPPEIHRKILPEGFGFILPDDLPEDIFYLRRPRHGKSRRGDHHFGNSLQCPWKKQHHPSSDDDYHYKNYIKILLLLHIITIDLIIEMMRTIVTVIMGLPTAFSGTSRLHQE